MSNVYDLKNIPAREIVPKSEVRFVHSENMTLAYWSFEEGAEIPEHSHEHEQVANVIEGEFEAVVDGKAMCLKPGNVAVIPSNVPHSGRALTPCRVIDVFHPVREDYR